MQKGWNDTLDAMQVAKDNHRLIHEDGNIRVVQVICPPGDEEPVHTHRYPSIMWVTQPGHLLYNVYGYNAQHQLEKAESIEIKPKTAEQLNVAEQMPPEGPHSITNIGTTTYIAYRIEFKKRS